MHHPMPKVFTLLMIWGATVNAQVNINDCPDNLLAAPEWLGDTEDYIILDYGRSLQLDAPAEAGVSRVYLEQNAMENARWSFHFKMGFNPSSSNYSEVWLAMDNSDFQSLSSAFYLVLGTTADNISLWQLVDGKKSLLIEGSHKLLDTSMPEGDVRVSRYLGGEIVLEVKMGEGWKEEGRLATSQGFESLWFGIASIYTSTRSKLFWYSDFQVCGEAYNDTTPPLYRSRRYDLQITEVMADPLPQMGLLDSEYIELFNRSKDVINLEGCKVALGSAVMTLNSYMLFPGEYLLLIPATQSDSWKNLPNRLEVLDWSPLSDLGSSIILMDSYGSVISSLNYHRDMGLEGFKKEGGWSLEVKDPDNLSGSHDNWGYSVNQAGGTPGIENSISGSFPDFEAPFIKGHYLLNDSLLIIEFSEPMDSASLVDIEIDAMSPGYLPTFSEASLTELFHSELAIKFDLALEQDRAFRLTFVSLPSDLAGNILEGELSLDFANPVSATSSDLVINELLFDPPAMGSDFVELFNRSNRHLDLSSLYISRGDLSGIPEKLFRLTDKKTSFFPGSYIVATVDRDWLIDYYKVDNKRDILSVPGMPNFVNSSGTVLLSDIKGNIYDRLSYSEEMHYPLLGLTKGVSLERIDADEVSDSRFNWHSASAEHGYATPGKRNSQAYERGDNTEEAFRLEPEVFTPNQDGFEDLLFIRYRFKEPGYCCTLTIYDRAGRPVRYLVNNELAGVEGTFAWDGTDERGALAPAGIYIILIRSFHPSGDSMELKKVAVLGVAQPL